MKKFIIVFMLWINFNSDISIIVFGDCYSSVNVLYLFLIDIASAQCVKKTLTCK